MRLRTISASLLFLCSSASALAQTVEIEFTNLMHGQSFTPRLVVAHDETIDTFEAGTEASTALAWLAEAGVIEDEQNPASAGQNFEALLGPESTDNGSNTWRRFGGLLSPSTTVTYQFDTMGKPLLSVLTMLIPTNDAFAGLDAIEIPTEPGVYTYTLNAYDAGTELNDELNSARTDVVEAGTGLALGGYGVPGVAGAPTSIVPLGTGATGVGVQVVNGEIEDGTDGPIHIHRNVLGDTNQSAGASDLNSTVHRWLNPVARLTITVPAS
jgi:hypothetical protein